MDKKQLDKNNTNINKNNSMVWKKILLFFVICPPYSLYLFLFKTKSSKIIKGIIVIIALLISLLVVDTIIHPNRVYDEIALEQINKLKLNKTISVGEVYNINKKNQFIYKDVEYISYYMYDEAEMYYVLFEVVEYNKEYKLVNLSTLSDTYHTLYENKFKEYNNIHPIILEHLLSENNNLLNNIIEVGDIEIKDIFYNNKTQVLTYDKYDITFEFNDFGIVQYKSNTEDIEYIAKDNPLYNTNFKTVYKILSKNFNNKYDIVGFFYFDRTPIFHVVVGDNKYMVQYYYGEGASLKSIDDEKLYYNSLEKKYNLDVK